LEKGLIVTRRGHKKSPGPTKEIQARTGRNKGGGHLTLQKREVPSHKGKESSRKTISGGKGQIKMVRSTAKTCDGKDKCLLQGGGRSGKTRGPTGYRNLTNQISLDANMGSEGGTLSPEGNIEVLTVIYCILLPPVETLCGHRPQKQARGGEVQPDSRGGKTIPEDHPAVGRIDCVGKRETSYCLSLVEKRGSREPSDRETDGKKTGNRSVNTNPAESGRPWEGGSGRAS